MKFFQGSRAVKNLRIDLQVLTALFPVSTAIVRITLRKQKRLTVEGGARFFSLFHVGFYSSGFVVISQCIFTQIESQKILTL